MRLFSGPTNIEILESSNDGVLSAQGVKSASVVAWVPKDYTNGLVLSKDTDTTNDINITLGDCADSGNAYILKLTGEITKQADATWAEGDDAGGTRAADHPISDSTQYYVYLMRKDDDGSLDVIFSSESSSPTLPSGWTAYRLIGRFYRDAAPANTNIVFNIDANTETGEWLPTLQDSSFSDAESQTYSNQFGFFTKIGKETQISGRLGVTSLGSLTGGDIVFIGGLPYASTASNIISTISFGSASSLAIGAGESVIGSIAAGGITRIQLALWDATTGTTNMTITQYSAGGIVNFSGSYTTA